MGAPHISMVAIDHSQSYKIIIGGGIFFWAARMAKQHRSIAPVTTLAASFCAMSSPSRSILEMYTLSSDLSSAYLHCDSLFSIDVAFFYIAHICLCQDRSLLSIMPTCLWCVTSFRTLPSMCIGGCAVKLALFDITRDSVLGGLSVTSHVLAHLLMADRSCSKGSAALSLSSSSINRHVITHVIQHCHDQQTT